jgi:hypothetical protein
MEKQTISIFPYVQNQWLNGHLDFQFQNFRWKNQRRRRWFFPPPTSRLPTFCLLLWWGRGTRPKPHRQQKYFSNTYLHRSAIQLLYPHKHSIIAYPLPFPFVPCQTNAHNTTKVPTRRRYWRWPPPLGIQLQLSYNCLQYTIYLIYNYILLRIIEVFSG